MSRSLPVLLVFALCANLAMAQTGRLDMSVKDQNGAGTPATGTVERLSAGLVTKFETDDKGTYSAGGLVPGRYRVEVKANGFATQSVLVDITNEPTALPITLAVGSETTRVEVVGGTPLPGVDL